MKIYSINVCGIKSKNSFSEFVEFINQYDIIGVQESKLDDLDNISIDCYEIIMHNRHRYSRYRSGGIYVIVKRDIIKASTFYKVKVALSFSSRLSLKIQLKTGT